MRGKNLIWLTLIALLLASPLFASVSFAAPDPVISIVNPFDGTNTVQTNPTESFLISIDVANAVNVAGFEVKLTWDKALTEFPPQAMDGSFLQDSGIPVHTTFASNFLFGYIIVGGFLTASGGVSGNGTLAYVMFQVKATESGTSPIHIADSTLFDQFGNLYTHTTVDGFFYTTKPYVNFSWTPTAPLPGDVVTFDGSASYDPDNAISDPTPGPLADFAWDFGDGSLIEHTTGPTVTHTYAAYMKAPYKVTLTVTDDDGESWFLTKDLRIWRDLGIVSVWPSMDEWDSTNYDGYQTQIDPYDMFGECWILITVNNFGTVRETFDVAVSVDGVDYNGVAQHFEPYPYVRRNRALAPGAGSGFSYWFVLDISYHSSVWGTNGNVPPGQYTITATVLPASNGASWADQDSSNNVLTASFGVHSSVEFQAFRDKQKTWSIANGPMPLGGLIKNFDNTFGVNRDPITIQGEWGNIVFEIMDAGTGTIVATLVTGSAYLNYDQMATLYTSWSTDGGLAPGKYVVNAHATFGINNADFPYWGEHTKGYAFTVVP